MKPIFAAEDCMIGIICGFLLLMNVGKIYPLKLNNVIYVAAFAVLIIFIILDILHELSDLSTHPLFIIFSLTHSIIHFVLSISFIAYFTGLDIPYISTLIVPLINETTIYYAGVFLVAANVIWLVIFPFTY